MDWPISPAAMQIATTARTANTATARQLNSLTVVDILGVCAQVAQIGGRAAFKSFIQSYWSSLSNPGVGLNRSSFAICVAESGSIPSDDTLGVDALDYQYARQFVLKVRDESTLVAAMDWPADARTIASSRPFYPEMIRGVNAWRQRIVSAATAHRDKGPISPQQWALLSLGSLYSMSGARNGSRPSTPAAGSILFARSVLHAAGCNVIHSSTANTCSLVGGLFSVLPKLPFGYTAASNMDIGMRPEAGDIFHIEGGAVAPDGTKIETLHVGVIVGVWGNIWLTIEGGGQDNLNRQRTRELVPVQSSHGKWGFKFDEASAKLGPRALQGWFSVSKFRHDLWMSMRPER